jgi:hypothetical protein
MLTSREHTTIHIRLNVEKWDIIIVVRTTIAITIVIVHHHTHHHNHYRRHRKTSTSRPVAWCHMQTSPLHGEACTHVISWLHQGR